jgi:hypothetical protein
MARKRGEVEVSGAQQPVVACACLEVTYLGNIETEGGPHRDQWACRNCEATFVREVFMAEKMSEANQALGEQLSGTAKLIVGITEALEIAGTHAMTSGGSHRMWVIDQMCRALCGSGYPKWRGDAKWGEGTKA